MFFFFPNIHNCSAAHQIGIELLAEVKRPEHEDKQSAQCSRLRMSGATPQLPLYGFTASTKTALYSYKATQKMGTFEKPNKN
jgi:hypothetical protein